MFWLIWNVIKANLKVAKIIWDPSLPIAPKWQRLRVNLETDLQKTFYANSITLMPGTLTTDVEKNSFMIHSLSQKDIDELKTGNMERKIRASGI